MNKYARDKVNGSITLIYGLSGNGWLQGGIYIRSEYIMIHAWGYKGLDSEVSGRFWGLVSFFMSSIFPVVLMCLCFVWIRFVIFIVYLLSLCVSYAFFTTLSFLLSYFFSDFVIFLFVFFYFVLSYPIFIYQ